MGLIDQLAKFKLKAPDALQIAAALLENCRVFITNDRDLPEIAGLQILQLSDLQVSISASLPAF